MVRGGRPPTPTPTLRTETPSDIAAIHALTRRAFAPMPFAGGDEPELVDALRSVGALSLSLVAEVDGVLAGHLALSPATHEAGQAGWFALGPISVEPALQRRGVGAALIARAKDYLVEIGARGCILTGNPNYYRRFGFVLAPENAPDAAPAAYFMVWAPSPPPPGRFRFHPVFDGPGVAT